MKTKWKLGTVLIAVISILFIWLIPAEYPAINWLQTDYQKWFYTVVVILLFMSLILSPMIFKKIRRIIAISSENHRTSNEQSEIKIATRQLDHKWHQLWQKLSHRNQRKNPTACHG